MLSPIILAVAAKTGAAPRDWEYFDGPAMGVGVEYWLRNAVASLDVYVCDDQYELTIEITEIPRRSNNTLYGPRITEISQLDVGDYLLGDSHHFHAANLYRVTQIIQDPADTKPSRFIVIYVHPSRCKTGENAGMCVWYWELEPQNDSYYRATKRLRKTDR